MVARILVAEEHGPSLVLMLHLLKGHGYSTVFATDGAAFVSLARQERPDMIVCDWRLSTPDGIQVVSKLLHDEHVRSIPLIAVLDVSRLGVVGGRKTPAGFVDHVGKPIEPQSFLDTVERHLPAPLLASRLPPRLRGQRRKTDPAVWRDGP